MNNTQAKILLIDDELPLLAITRAYLKRMGYSSVSLSDPRNAVQTAISEKPALILLDWVMPHCDGITVLKQLKLHDKTKHIPVIIMTGAMTESVDLKTALEAGAQDYIRKPLDETELAARTGSAIKLHSQFSEELTHLETVHREEKEKLEVAAERTALELERKKKELIDNALRMVHTSELTAKLVAELESAAQNFPDSESDLLSKIISKYADPFFEAHWNVFESSFIELHTSFLENLLRKHPDLSPNERKLCAYFRLDMSTKDIASITFSSYDSVRKARTRLRKKLELTSEDDIFEYLRTF